MKLLYIYIQFLNKQGVPQKYRSFEKLELNFSTTGKFSYDAIENTLRFSERRIPLPDHFWSNNKLGSDYQNIYNINVIAGVNGSGKTTAIHCVMEMLECFYSLAEEEENDNKQTEYGNRALMVIDINGVEYLLDYSPSSMEVPNSVQFDESLENRMKAFICHGKKGFILLRTEERNEIISALLKTKVAYITNTLNQYDYEHHDKEQIRRRERFIYDASLGGMIGTDISEYFLSEIYKQVKYVFNDVQIGRQREVQAQIHELTLPKTLKLHLRFDAFQDAINGFISPFFGEIGESFQSTLLHSQLSFRLSVLCIASYAKELSLRGAVDLISQLSKQKGGTGKKIQQEETEPEQLLNTIEYAFCSSILKVKLKEHKTKVTCLSVVGDKWLISASEDNTIKVWDTYSAECLVTFDGHKTKCTCLIVLPASLVVSGSMDGILMVWDASTGKIIKEMRKVEASVTCIAKLSDRIIVSGYADGSLRLWNVVNGKCIQEAKEQTGKITCVVCLPDGQIVSGSTDCTLQFWNPSDNRKILKKQPEGITCISALSSGLIVCGMEGGLHQVWDPSSCKCLRTNRGHSAGITCIAEIDENHIVTGSHDMSLRVWDVSSGKCLQRYEKHNQSITCVAYIGDKQIVSASKDQNIRIWNCETGITSQIEEHRAGITCMTVLPDGRVASGDSIGDIIIWIMKKECDSEYVMRNDMARFAVQLRQKCVQYLEFIKENSKLLTLFSAISDNTYVISLNDKNTTIDTNQAMVQFFRHYYDTCNLSYTIDFDWGLSSGEENMLRIFSELFHLLIYVKPADCRIYNIHDRGIRWEWTKDDTEYAGGRDWEWTECSTLYDRRRKWEWTECDTLLLFMDEADLTLHPEWQHRFIAIMTAYIPSIFPASCVKDIQLVLSTHSPLMLGDIPGENITYLIPSEMKNENAHKPHSASDLPLEQTFGQNIHTILMNSFFLNRTIGQFAYQKIIDIADELEALNRAQKNAEDPVKLHEWQEKCQQYKCIIECIGDPIIRNKLMNMYNACFKLENSQMDIQQKLMQIQELGEAASEKERESMISDLKKVINTLRLKGRSDLS